MSSDYIELKTGKSARKNQKLTTKHLIIFMLLLWWWILILVFGNILKCSFVCRGMSSREKSIAFVRELLSSLKSSFPILYIIICQ